VQNIGVIVTVVAAAIIAVIFAVYLLILRRMGWLGGKSNFYRCPNQECKKIFQKPVDVKDLSETPPRIYPACPECGAKLDTFFGSRTGISSKIKQKTLLHQKKPKIKSIGKKPEEKIVSKINQVSNQVPKPVSKPEKIAPSQQTMTSREKKNETDDSECQYYFGYLARREKAGEIPASCLGCSKSLDCMLCVLKAPESVGEIKKWYQFTS
jgi:hypothetical protein